MALGLGIETGVRPGGRDPEGRTGPPSVKPGGDRRMESLLSALPLPLGSRALGKKLGIAVWLIEGWL